MTSDGAQLIGFQYNWKAINKQSPYRLVLYPTTTHWPHYKRHYNNESEEIAEPYKVFVILIFWYRGV